MKKLFFVLMLMAATLVPVFSISKEATEYMNKAKKCLNEGEIVWAYYYYGCAYSEDGNNIEALEKREEIYTFIQNGDISLGKSQLDDFETHDRWFKIINDYYYVSVFCLDEKDISLSASLRLERVNYDTRTYDYYIDIHKNSERKSEIESIRTAINEGLEIVRKSTWSDVNYYVSEYNFDKCPITEDELIKNNYFLRDTYFSYVKEPSYDNYDKKIYGYIEKAAMEISFERENGDYEKNMIFDVEIVNKEGKIIQTRTLKKSSDYNFYSVKEPEEELSVRIKGMTLLYGSFDKTKFYNNPSGYKSYCISDSDYNKLKKIIYKESDIKEKSINKNLRIDQKIQICNDWNFIILNEKNNNIYTKEQDFLLNVQHDENLINNRNFDVLLYSDIEKNATQEEFMAFLNKERILRKEKIAQVGITTDLNDTYLVYNRARDEVFTNNLILSGKDFDFSKYKIVDYEKLRDDEAYYTNLKNEISEAQLVYDNIKQYFSYSFNKWNYSTNSYTLFNTKELESVKFSFYDKKRNLFFSKNEILPVSNPKEILAQAEVVDSFIIVIDEIFATTDLKSLINASLKKIEQYYNDVYYKYYAERDFEKQLSEELENTYFILGTGIAGIRETGSMNMTNVFYKKIEKNKAIYKTYYISNPAYGCEECFLKTKPEVSYPSVEEMKENKKAWNIDDKLNYFIKYDEKTHTTIHAWNPKKDKITKFYPSSAKEDLRRIRVYTWELHTSFPKKNFIFTIK